MSTKIHAAVDALGNPVRFILTQGQSSEYEQANGLIVGFQADVVLADKGYDANNFVENSQAGGSVAVMPPRKKPD